MMITVKFFNYVLQWKEETVSLLKIVTFLHFKCFYSMQSNRTDFKMANLLFDIMLGE